MKKIIERDRQKLKRRAGKFMLAEMARWANNLQDLLSSSEIIRFEVIDAQRVDYQYKFQNLTWPTSQPRRPGLRYGDGLHLLALQR